MVVEIVSGATEDEITRVKDAVVDVVLRGVV
jgi:hypothetical protein